MQGWGGEAGREQRSHLKKKEEKKKDKKTTPALHGGRQNDCTKAPFQGWNFTTPTWLKDSTEGGGRRLKATVLQINLFLVRMAWIRKHLCSLGSTPFPHLQASPYPLWAFCPGTHSTPAFLLPPPVHTASLHRPTKEGWMEGCSYREL